jgi:hypothetical protein
MADQPDPQDLAEQLDDDAIHAGTGDPEQNGLLDLAPDEPLAVEEELVTEPIVDSVASRDERLQPETIVEIQGPSDDLRSVLVDSVLVDDPQLDVGDLAADPSELAPEDAALHVIDDANLG